MQWIECALYQVRKVLLSFFKHGCLLMSNQCAMPNEYRLQHCD
jgi:hypothetical protein